jgi:hypothetical protein
MAEIGVAHVTVEPRWREAHLAKRIEVLQGSEGFSLTIDGLEFPWFITEQGVTTESTIDGMPVVTVSILAETIRTVQSQTKNALGK